LHRNSRAERSKDFIGVFKVYEETGKSEIIIKTEKLSLDGCLRQFSTILSKMNILKLLELLPYREQLHIGAYY